MGIATTTTAYRDASALVAPGKVFRTARRLVMASLVIVGVVAVACCVGRLVFDACVDNFAARVCERINVGRVLDGLDVPVRWERWLANVPTSVPAALAALDVLLAVFLLRPRTATLDPATRTLLLVTTRWPRRARVVRLRFEDIEVVEVCMRWRLLYSVRLLDARGVLHTVTGLGVSRARATSVACALEAAAGLEPLPDDEWLCAVRAAKEADASPRTI
jgi:hypothetical protein